MDKEEIQHLQRELNKFVEAHPALGHAKVRVDGDKGRLTNKLLRDVKYDIGYRRENMDFSVNSGFFKRMARPNHVENTWGQTKKAVKRGQKRRVRRRRSVRANRLRGFFKPGVGTFDGKPVAKCLIPILSWCREHGWHGVLVSGWRDPRYSQSLCFRMCGRASCPGMCAGLASNHVGNSPEKCAADVSDYVNFRETVSRCPIKPRIHNALPRDRVHFSPSGA